MVIRLPCRVTSRGVHGNGEDWDPMGMGVRSAMGWEWKLSAWEWELRRGSCHQFLHSNMDSNAGGATA